MDRRDFLKGVAITGAVRSVAPRATAVSDIDSRVLKVSAFNYDLSMRLVQTTTIGCTLTWIDCRLCCGRNTSSDGLRWLLPEPVGTHSQTCRLGPHRV